MFVFVFVFTRCANNITNYIFKFIRLTWIEFIMLWLATGGRVTTVAHYSMQQRDSKCTPSLLVWPSFVGIGAAIIDAISVLYRPFNTTERDNNKRAFRLHFKRPSINSTVVLICQTVPCIYLNRTGEMRSSRRVHDDNYWKFVSGAVLPLRLQAIMQMNGYLNWFGCDEYWMGLNLTDNMWSIWDTETGRCSSFDLNKHGNRLCRFEYDVCIESKKSKIIWFRCVRLVFSVAKRNNHWIIHPSMCMPNQQTNCGKLLLVYFTIGVTTNHTVIPVTYAAHIL